MTTGQNITPLELEAALCVWEYLNEISLADTINPNLSRLRESIGTAQLRSHCLDIGRYCLKVYDLLPPEARDGHAYDWEIIPAIVDTISFDDGVLPALTLEKAAAVVTEALTHSDQPKTEGLPVPPTNASRAARAKNVLRAYTQSRGEAFQLNVEVIADLIADLLHLIEHVTDTVDAPGYALQLGKLHYDAERAA